MNTRLQQREFSKAFGRPINSTPVPLNEDERILLGNLIFEECLEYLTLGLGLSVCYGPLASAATVREMDPAKFALEASRYRHYDPVEAADGLGDMNVVIHFNSSWHGFNLDNVTNEIHRSNMSKLDEDGQPIINGVTPGYRNKGWTNPEDGGQYMKDEAGFDSTRPVGKILKGPNYSRPNIQDVIFEWPYNYLDESECPGHTASDGNAKVCKHCGIHVDSLRPDTDDFDVTA